MWQVQSSSSWYMPSVRATSVLLPITYGSIYTILYDRDFKTPLRKSHSSCGRFSPLPRSICHLFVQHLFCFLLHMAQFTQFFYERDFKTPLKKIHSSCGRCSPLPLVYAICSYSICFVSYYICAQFTQFLYERNFKTPLKKIHSSCGRCSPLPLVYAICSCKACFVSYIFALFIPFNICLL